MGSETYHFGQFDLDPSRGQLCCNRRPIRIKPQIFALLCYLVEHRDRVVSPRELLETVWGSEFVTRAALTTALRAVRLTIGDTGREQRFIRTVQGRGYQFIAATTVATAESSSAAGAATRAVPVAAVETTTGARDTIRFCRTADGARVAWAVTGAGPPLVRTANWLSQMDLERTMPMFTHWFEGLTRGRRLIRYDERGYGLSDWTTGFTLEEWIEDLDAVADAAGLDRFPLLGVSQGGPLAVAYAARRPERVSRLVLNAAYARGRIARARDAAEHDEADLDLKLTLAGWHAQDHSYQRFFGSQFFAGSPPQRWDEFTSYQKRSVSSANGARFLEEQSRLDVSDLAHRVSCPTLIVHSRDDPRVPVSQAAELAQLIADSRLVLLDGRNHLLTADEPAWPRFLDELDAFLAEEEPGRG
ncbi:transcriptional regulator [Acrocarpospora pleiomorpha]|uniref:Transcriptional regulator n=1 Tax=Acrocarpospora pleiomorpha TaxID=90975 RepID=A0A5M3X9L7_9ACTN|nr:alpha/beta fold hydrolase [Acrocarpospora pleiomorpha]GES17432.1 transcriptional regulator [Acrocarpospora pleiomorpha]